MFVFPVALTPGAAFQRPTGALRVSVVFNPHQPYGELMHLASIDSDSTEALRDALVKEFVPAALRAKTLPTINDLEWEAIGKLPERILVECVFKEAGKFAEYTDLVKLRIAAAFKCGFCWCCYCC